MDLERRLDGLRAIQRALDSAFRVPGTRIRFGWDPIVGLVPWLGDGLTALLACAIVIQAHQMRVPRVIQMRMLVNIAIDLLVGIVPVAGDIADVFWKANDRNMMLLDRHAGTAVPPRIGDWLFVGAILIAVAALAVLPFVVAYSLFHLIARAR